jgi:hypothetical protein
VDSRDQNTDDKAATEMTSIKFMRPYGNGLFLGEKRPQKQHGICDADSETKCLGGIDPHGFAVQAFSALRVSNETGVALDIAICEAGCLWLRNLHEFQPRFSKPQSVSLASVTFNDVGQRNI